jgi:hypothetical protein
MLSGGYPTMIEIESPLIQELMAQQRHMDIVGVLEERFGGVPQDIITALGAIQEDKRLGQLIRWAVRCPDLETFRQQLPS